jgi:hypothetical protein
MMAGNEGGIEPPSPAGQENEAEEKSALLPKSMFPEGAKPGDTITLKVIAAYGDEIEVSAAEAPEGEENEPPSADEELDSMSAGGKTY